MKWRNHGFGKFLFFGGEGKGSSEEREERNRQEDGHKITTTTCGGLVPFNLLDSPSHCNRHTHLIDRSMKA